MMERNLLSSSPSMHKADSESSGRHRLQEQKRQSWTLQVDTHRLSHQVSSSWALLGTLHSSLLLLFSLPLTLHSAIALVPLKSVSWMIAVSCVPSPQCLPSFQLGFGQVTEKGGGDADHTNAMSATLHSRLGVPRISCLLQRGFYFLSSGVMRSKGIDRKVAWGTMDGWVCLVVTPTLIRLSSSGQ